MGKYAPLREHLLNRQQKVWHAHFTEIEKIIGQSLPKSARHYHAWWANQEYSPQCSAWLEEGWITSDIDLPNETVVFKKDRTGKIKGARKSSDQAREGNVSEPSFHSWDTNKIVTCSLGMEWCPIGQVQLDKIGRIVFPDVKKTPALYRFRIRKSRKEKMYIGETVNLKRRFGNYRNPGSSQQTSKRINKILVTMLKEGAEISVSVMMSGAWVDKGNGQEVLDLSSKVARCFLENAAILEEHALDVESLNKANL